MKIACWIDLFDAFAGGAQTVARDLTRALRSRGHDLLVIADDPDRDRPTTISGASLRQWEGVPIARLPMFRAMNERAPRLAHSVVFEGRRMLQSFAPDVILVFFPTYGVPFFFSCRSAVVAPVVVSVVHPVLGATAAYRAMLPKLFATADAIVAVSHAVARSLTTDPTRVSVISNGIAPPGLAPAPLDPSPTVVSIGRLAREKGVDLAIRAMHRAREALPSITLMIAGDGPDRERLIALTHQLGLSDIVTFAGFVPDPYRFINEASFVVMPTRDVEGFGLVVVEAAMMGRPTIGAATTGLMETIVHGETGLLVDQENVDALADAIIRLGSDLGFAARLGASARERALRCFSYPRVADEYETLLQTVVARSRVERAMERHP